MRRALPHKCRPPRAHDLLRDYLLRDYLLRDYLLRDYLLRDYLLRDYLLRDYLLRDDNLLSVGSDHRRDDDRRQPPLPLCGDGEVNQEGRPR